MISIGISISDFVAARGHVESSVYARVDYIEYGGYAPLTRDPGVEHIRGAGLGRRVSRHLVSTELAAELDIASECARIGRDLDGLAPEYLVTDYGFWRLGSRDVESLWARPCALQSEAAARVAHNALALQAHLGISVYPENPFAIYEGKGDKNRLSVTEFLCELAERGAEICFDIGHYYAACKNAALPVDTEFERLPFDAFRMVHIAGLSQADYAGQRFFLDNHTVPPLPVCLDMLAETIRRTPNLAWVTYEAELAPTDVQHAGLNAIERIVR